MQIHIDPVELTHQPSLWRVSAVRGDPEIVALHLPGLDPIRVDSQRDEDARVWAWPGQPMYCYRCKVSSNDPNPFLGEVPEFPNHWESSRRAASTSTRLRRRLFSGAKLLNAAGVSPGES
jgi:hypothetical protein